jgi:phosphohistidine swiveling domain-containing protein
LAKRYVYSLSSRWLHPHSGSKAANLHFLLRHHVQVPDSWVVSWTACDENLRNSLATKDAIRSELNTIIDPQKRYAVRSSASVEDSGDFSCAGLFKSYLQVQGIDDIMLNIGKVWESLESPEFKAYWHNIMPAGTNAHMAVIIQEMVQARFAGVVFTKNPMTGLSETIIEAGTGTGEAQAEEHQNPERWISKWGLWSQKPKDNILTETLARDIVIQTTEISRRYKRPADLEWAWDGEKLYILQIRPITHLDIPIYSNRIAREMLPGVIKPLVWSVNTRLINPTWVRILTRLTGERSWDPYQLTGHYYYRAYFNMGIFARVFERLGMPGEALELLLGLEHDGPEKPHLKPGPGIIFRLPRLLAFALSFVGINYRLNRLIKVKQKSYEKLAALMDEEREPNDWINMATRIFDESKDVAYFNIMIPLLSMMHHRMLAGLLKKRGVDARLIELHGAKEAASRYNPQNTLQKLHNRYYGESQNTSEGRTELSREQEEKLKGEIDDFLNSFGHFSDSGNDCSSIPWRETPDLIRRMIARPQQSSKSELKVQKFEDLKLNWLQRILIGSVFRRTSRFAVSREEISSLYTFGYGQFRTCFVKLGEQLVKQGVIEEREDVFYLYWQELMEICASHGKGSMHDTVVARRQEIESYRDAILPELIVGSEQPPVMTSFEVQMKGIPTSLGTYSGPARVILGITDFEKLNDGDVLIIPFSDVGWTPLFAKAGAVLAESGGMLSHSSIVAREYGIPAVVSVAGACRIVDGTQISVNGYTGEIALL